MTEPPTIGARIKDAREELALSQHELGRAAKLDHSYISLIEAGKRHPTMDALVAIADVLDVAALYLHSGPGTPVCPFCLADQGVPDADL